MDSHIEEQWSILNRNFKLVETLIDNPMLKHHHLFAAWKKLRSAAANRGPTATLAEPFLHAFAATRDKLLTFEKFDLEHKLLHIVNQALLHILNKFDSKSLIPYILDDKVTKVQQQHEDKTEDPHPAHKFLQACYTAGADRNILDNFPDYQKYNEVLHHLLDYADTNEPLQIALIDVWRTHCPKKNCIKSNMCLCIAHDKHVDEHLLRGYIIHVMMTHTDISQARSIASKAKARDDKKRPRKIVTNKKTHILPHEKAPTTKPRSLTKKKTQILPQDRAPTPYSRIVTDSSQYSD